MQRDKAFHSPLTGTEVQELLCFHGYTVVIDGQVGAATKYALRMFEQDTFGSVGTHSDDELRTGLIDPWLKADWLVELVKSRKPTKVSEALLYVAKYFLDLRAMEIGGNNMGPWVRYFSDGSQGVTTQWCANFAARTALNIAETAVFARLMAKGLPLPYKADSFDSGWCPAIAKRAQDLNRCIKSEDVDANPTKVHPGMLFLVRSADRASHIGIVMDINTKDGIFESIEGNASDPTQGSIDRVHRRFRNYRTSPYYFVNLD